MRARLLILLTAVLFLSALILVPEIIEAKRATLQLSIPFKEKNRS